MSRYVRTLLFGIAGILLLTVAGCNLGQTATATPVVIVITQTPGPTNTPVAVENTPTLVPPVEPPPGPEEPAAFDGLVWNDLNWDGVQSIYEPGIPNITVTLLTSSNTETGTAITDVNGAFRFENLMPGDYHLVVFPPSGFVFSPQDQGENDLVDSDPDPGTSQTVPVTLLSGENSLVWTTGVYSPTVAVQLQPGTVQPPPSDIDVCLAGVYSLGGISTLSVSQLATDYCLHAFLWNHGFAIGRIPGGAGRILAEVTFVEVYYQNLLTYKYDVPGQTNSIQVCYAVPAGVEAQIYFYDHYGPRFGNPAKGREWVPLATTINNGIACAVAQTTGAYALIGD